MSYLVLVPFAPPNNTACCLLTWVSVGYLELQYVRIALVHCLVSLTLFFLLSYPLFILY
jgi:hypothetical protein